MSVSTVGIGASAGGLGAFRRLRKRLPQDTGLAFVLLQHGDPKRHSDSTPVLTGLSADGMEVELDQIYVKPQKAELEIVNNVLQITLGAAIDSDPSMPIDRFLRSLEQECGSRAAAVILSGVGTDGSAGLKAVEAGGGVTVPQDPATAKFDSMEVAAIQTGSVDFVLSPEAIAAKLITLARQRYMPEDEDAGEPGSRADLEPQFETILSFVREATGVEIWLYRPAMIRRCVMRRLALLKTGTLDEYRDRLGNDPRELAALRRDLLTNDTHFFRGPEFFGSLRRLVFPHLARDRFANAPIRIWVPGCGTGEEAYSIAISLQKYFREADIALSLTEEQKVTKERGQLAVADANEELQRLNEELETAKQKLQSINEELTTANRELVSKNSALAEAHDFAMLIIQTAATPLLVLDFELRIKTANQSFYREFQISPREAEGQYLFSVRNGCWDIPCLRDMLKGILPDHKAVQGFEIQRDFPEIGHRVLVIDARQLDGMQQILLGIEDVTERQGRSQAKLQESEERFRSMADAAPVLIWISDRDRRRTFFNKGWLALTGRTTQQEAGDGWAENVHPEDLQNLRDTYKSSFDARRNFQLEYRLRRADGEYRWLLDNAAPRFEGGGVFAGYIGSCLDITDLKRAHEEHLAKQKLETVGMLAGGIAHDFNNLLGGMLANSELALAELSSGSDPRNELEKIRDTAILGAEIVRQLSVYAGEESEVVESVDISEIVEEMLGLLQVSISKNITVETGLDNRLPKVRANPSQMRQVVMNLISNASDAIGDRDGVIRLTTRPVTIGADSPQTTSDRMTEGNYVELEVTDTGRGMSPELPARIFDPFFTTKVGGNRGLGLAVVQRIVQRLHGTIRVSSAPGKGTTFQIFLPCEEDLAQATDRATASVHEETTPFRRATILVVEDEDLLRQAVSAMLRKKGLSVLEASDGSAALDLIRANKEHIHMLLLDITLPRASSREVYAEAKRLRPDFPVIVTSAKAEGVAAALLQTRAERFLRKPFRLSELVDVIRDILSSQRMQVQS